jgi:hypothetical protein
MAKFHINGKGEAGKCSATKGGCPFGGESEHFTSPEAAREAYEASMSTPVAAPYKNAMESVLLRPLAKNGLPAGVKNIAGTKSTSSETKSKFSRPDLPERVERSVFRYRTGTVNGIFNKHLHIYAPQLNGAYQAEGTYNRGQLFAMHRLVSDAYVKVNREEDDSFAVAEKIAKQYKKLAAKDGVIRQDHLDLQTEAVDKAAFAYVSPHVYNKSVPFEEALKDNGLTLANVDPKDPRGVTRVFAKAAKKAGAQSTPLQLARAFRDSGR